MMVPATSTAAKSKPEFRPYQDLLTVHGVPISSLSTELNDQLTKRMNWLGYLRKFLPKGKNLS